MGQHKHNPTAQLAKEGKLPPKEPQMSKRESERIMMARVQNYLFRRICARGGSALERKFLKARGDGKPNINHDNFEKEKNNEY